MTDLEAKIREQAYALWLAEGQPDGRHEHHWSEARRMVDDVPEGAGLDASPTFAASPEVAAEQKAKASRGRKRAAR
ncbi:DUF2934 domain-containing protein [Chthonobacter rhizosphaerae]|uniref:DUF2934 domain-containing protein n=1 Tax=Chthonobacter rhizosphaerae TaxID=2735553 RepID=UPI0015EEDFCE|nr:DUF2934 domain-containing protein [Chthonobacter rhizosphaerae]